MNQDTKRHPGQKPEDEGFSLVMSLIFISLLSILVVGFLTSMRTEVNVSEEHARSSKAAVVAQMGTDMALSRLRYATGSVSGKTWISMPGQIYILNLPLSTGMGSTSVLLHSGASTYGASDTEAADLNQGTNHLIAATPDKLRVKWIYVRQNGDIETGTPTYSASNPLTGRFAFWVDDESARINLNTAYQRNATSSQVNLSIFPTIFPSTNSATADALANFRSSTISGHYFNTLDEVRGVTTISNTIASLLNTDRFSLGVHSRAPDLNMFGEPRIVLTTQKSLANGAPFLDILKDAAVDADPGSFANLDPVKVKSMLIKLMGMMTRSDWYTNAATASFAGKYKGYTTAAGVNLSIWQLPLNIIDYVRSKESALQLIEPTRITVNTVSGDIALDGGNGLFIGAARSIRMTELGLQLYDSATPNRGYFIITYELHIPPYCGVTGVNLNDYTASIYFQTNTYSKTNTLESPFTLRYEYNASAAPSNATNASFISGAFSISTGTATPAILSSGGYSKVQIRTSEFLYLTKTASATLTTSYSRSDLIYANWPGFAVRGADASCRFDYTNLGAYNISDMDAGKSYAVDDPFNNKYWNDWKLIGSPTWGGINTTLNTLGMTPTLSGPQQDVGPANTITNVGLQIPAPAGHATLNPYGVVMSVAELGYIHSGIETATFGTPYRTLRMQPRKGSAANTLPDWLLLDMFSAPTKRWKNPSNHSLGAIPVAFYAQPAVATTTSLSQSLDGQININTGLVPVTPFTDATNNNVTRTTPLRAAFLGAYSDQAHSLTVSSVATTTMAASLTSKTLSSTGGNAGNRYGNSWPLFVSRGEIAEFSGVADAAITSSGEAIENQLQGVVDVLTTRGSVFRIYSVGQSIIQSSGGAITTTGESRTMSIVERVPKSATAVDFKTIYNGKPY